MKYRVDKRPRIFTSVVGKVDFKDYALILNKRNLQTDGALQKKLDKDILRYSNAYVPKRSGNLVSSGNVSEHGGYVTWSMPYAKKQYYHNRGKGLRGRRWFERMMVDYGDFILKNAAENISK